MRTTEEIIIDILSRNIKEFASELGYSYVNGGYGYWEDGAGKIHEISSMNCAYIENCINFVDRGLDQIDDGIIDTGIQELFKGFVRKKDTDKELKYKRLEMTSLIMESTKKQLRNTLLAKKEELEEQM